MQKSEVVQLEPLGWNFAAVANNLLGIPGAVVGSANIEGDRKPEFADATSKVGHALAELLATGLLGDGPYSVTCSGTKDRLYLSVIAKP